MKCDNCKFYSKLDGDFLGFGECENEKVKEQVATDPPAGILFSKDFGCINFEQKP